MEFIAYYSVLLVKQITFEVIIKIIALVISSLGAVWLSKKIKILWKNISYRFFNGAKVKRARDAINSDKGLWLSIPMTQKDLPNKNCDVVLIANLKGGVGKTTVTANLSAHCAVKRDEKILCVDFDYQGSLTSMAFPDAIDETLDGSNSRAGKLIDGEYNDELLASIAIPLPQTSNFKFIPSDYPLAQVENRLMVSWLLGDTDDDIRGRLANVFSGDNFERIIIDAPPRLTTSCIQGLYVSSRIIIPTILDGLGTPAVGRFIEQIYDLRLNGLCPNLKKIHVLGTMVDLGNSTDRSQYEFLKLALNKYVGFVELVPFELSVPEKKEFSRRAGNEIAYLNAANNQTARDIRQIFDNLGAHIWG